MRIIAKAVHDVSKDKLLRAGADAVVAPNYIGGLRMASEMIRPHVTTFLDNMLRDPDHTVRIDEITVKPGSSLVGRTVAEVNHEPDAVLLVLAIQAAGDRQMRYDPPDDHRLEAGTTLIVLAESAPAERLRQRAEL
jgi:voltage-gated potassium channel